VISSESCTLTLKWKIASLQLILTEFSKLNLQEKERGCQVKIEATTIGEEIVAALKKDPTLHLCNEAEAYCIFDHSFDKLLMFDDSGIVLESDVSNIEILARRNCYYVLHADFLVCKFIKTDDNINILENLSQCVKDSSKVKNSNPETGSFKILYTKYVKENNVQQNFCYRNKVIVDFPRKCNLPCKITIYYQYRQFGNLLKPFIKIYAKCENGPCHYQFIIMEHPDSDGNCSVHFTVHAMFKKDEKEIHVPVHDTVASSPIKGKYREKIFNDTVQKGTFRTYNELINKADEAEIGNLNLTTAVSPSVVRKIASERLKDFSTLENIKLAILERREHEFDPFNTFSGLIRNITQDPYAVYMYTEDQLKVFIKCVNESSWDNPVQIAFDTSGDIFPTTKTKEGKKKILQFWYMFIIIQ
jgi:hypothetical protein